MQRKFRKKAKGGTCVRKKQQFNDMLNGRKIIRPLDTKAIAIALEVDANELFKVSEKEVGRR